jgi:stage III sporulation protein AB
MDGREGGCMTIKIIGAVLITIGCGGFGVLIASAHRNLTSTLRQFIMILDLMECELQYRQTHLPDLCQMAAQNSSGIIRKIFLSLTTELEKQISPNVEKCLDAVLQNTDNIPKNIKEVFLLLGQSLGRFDLDGQLKGIQMVKSETMRILDVHTNNQDMRIRCYQTLSICAGAAIAILFI